ncbi:threonyl-tRNA synthetase editing domain-containing protein [Halorussus halobius]|uniref:threonyl-tRNA synthetase editing domain-containing protein n=1 Tax=Halorussus halobius TaxID=1710537 RepID=UPI00143D2347|nr:threonyl-tRNA synthetase editing domain-containing protein [Halorussus halobius]
MRLLVVHADRFAFETVAPAEVGGDATGRASAGVDEPPDSGRVDDCLAVFATVERADAADLDAAAANAAAEIRAVADRLGVGAVALYPVEHLSDESADAELAATALPALGADLDADFEVVRAPVEWHAAFEVSSKGHPHAERTVRVGPDREADDRADRDAPSPTDAAESRVAFPDGDVVDAREAVTDRRLDDPMRSFVAAELGDGSAREPDATDLADPSEVVERLREAGLADADSAGGLRWFPRGALARDLLAEHLTGLAVEYGATVMETTGGGPGAVDRRPPSEGDRPRRRYGLVARPAPDGGPTLSTPEIRAATRDTEQARTELRAQVDRCRRAVESLGSPWVARVRTTGEWYDENDTWVASLVATLGAPTLVEPSTHRAGPSLAVELALVDDAGAPAVSARAEYDPATDGAGATVRATPVDSVERALAATLGARDGDAHPRTPTWLAPTQVRFVPVDDEHADHCDALAGDLDAAGVRADVDDREATVGERIARAEADRVPYYAVVGDREVKRGGRGEDALAVTVRAEGREREMDAETLRATVRDAVDEFPRKRRYLARRLGERPDVPGR